MTNDALNQFSFFTRPMRAGRTVGLAVFVITIFSLIALTKNCSAADLMKPQAIEDPSGLALQHFYEALKQTEQQTPASLTRIIHYGDSHVAADWLTGKLRRNFQRDFGAESLIYEARGINGARATKPLGWNWKVLAEQFSKRNPDLIVVAYGSNEVGDADLDLTEYQQQFTELLQRFHKAAPQASLLVLAPPDREQFVRGKWRTMPAMLDLIEVQRQAAFAEGAAFWNQFQAMGGAGSINHWAQFSQPLAQKDRTHLTRAGYSLVADAFYAELLCGYEEYLNAKEN